VLVLDSLTLTLLLLLVLTELVDRLLGLSELVDFPVVGLSVVLLVLEEELLPDCAQVYFPVQYVHHCPFSQNAHTSVPWGMYVSHSSPPPARLYTQPVRSKGGTSALPPWGGSRCNRSIESIIE
jgi:hypothetical protein